MGKTINMALRRLHRRFGAEPFSVSNGRAVTKLRDFVAWAEAFPEDENVRLVRATLTKYRLQPVAPVPVAPAPVAPAPVARPMPKAAPAPREAFPEAFDAPAPAKAPPARPVAPSLPSLARGIQGEEIARLHKRFKRSHFTSLAAAELLRMPDFESWAKDNPIQDGLQIMHFARRWHVVALNDRLAEKIVPRLQQLRQPFGIAAASLMLNGMPIQATNQILSTLVQGGIAKPGNKVGTFSLVKQSNQWWAS